MSKSESLFASIERGMAGITPTPPATPLRPGLRVFKRLQVAREKMERGERVWGSQHVSKGREFWCGTPNDIFQFLKEAEGLYAVTQYLLTDPVSLNAFSHCKFYIDFEFTRMKGLLIENGGYTAKGTGLFHALSYMSGDEEFAANAVQALNGENISFNETLAKKVLTLLMDTLTIFLCSRVKGQTSKDVMEGWVVSSSSYKLKISFYLINTSVVLEDHHNLLRHLVIEYNYWVVKALMPDLQECIVSHDATDLWMFYFCGFGEGRHEDSGPADPAVYTKSQGFRLDGCVKAAGGKEFVRPLRPISVSLNEVALRYEFNTTLFQSASYMEGYCALVGSLCEFEAGLLEAPPSPNVIRIGRGNITRRPYTKDYKEETCAFIGERKPASSKLQYK